ncbi:MAG: MoaD/ThiS family protein [Desulfobacterales bacterium]|nr:MoaD/ThiS family protein [Desulfobacterales bacterium]
MQVTIKLFANFRNNRFNKEVRTIAPGITVGAIVTELAIAEEEVGVILINGRHGSLNQALAEGDSLSLFPLIGGG